MCADTHQSVNHTGEQNATHQEFNSVQEVIKGDEGTLCLNVSVLGEMSPGARCLSTVRLGDGEHVPKCWDAGLQVELRRLSEVGLGKREVNKYSSKHKTHPAETEVALVFSHSSPLHTHLLAKVIELEEGGASLHLRLHKGGRGHFNVAILKIVVSEADHVRWGEGTVAM